MKVKPSVKRICEKCKIIKRKGRVTRLIIKEGGAYLWHVLPV